MRTAPFGTKPRETVPPPEAVPSPVGVRVRRPPVNKDPIELEPAFLVRVERVIKRLEDEGWSPLLWETLRTEERARFLKMSGASRNGHLSMHCHRIGADIICGGHMWSCRKHGCKFFEALGEAARAEGLTWGGDWKTFVDKPHVQAVPVRLQGKVRKAGSRAAVRAIVAAYLLGASLLSACGSDPQPEQHRHTEFANYPVDVLMSPDLSRCESAAIVAAVAWVEWMSERDLARVRFTARNDVAVHGLPDHGQVGVSHAPMGSMRTLGEATIYKTKSGEHTHSVDVRIGGCDPRIAAHEMAHALLGAPHDQRGVMSHRPARHLEWNGPL